MTSIPRWALVTGASSGIGLELARLLAARGFRLVLVARRGDRLRALAAELPTETAIEVHDLEDPAAPAALIAAVERRGIAVHTLVNNAGFGLRGGFATLPADQQAGMLELNVVALTKLCRAFMPGMIARRSGGILNVSSVAGFLPGPGMAVYFASKAYVLSLSEALYEEARPHGVAVTALCPGSTETEFAARADMETSRAFRKGVMSAAEVARIGLAGHERGEAVVVTGGLNRAATLGIKLLPRAVTRRAAARLQGGDRT